MKGSPYTILGMAALLNESSEKIASMTETHISNVNFGIRNYGGIEDRLRYSICAMKAVSSVYSVGDIEPLSGSDVSSILSKIR